MKRVEQDGEWSLMCPAQCPGLSECWGKEFEELYTRYEKVRRRAERITNAQLSDKGVQLRPAYIG